MCPGHSLIRARGDASGCWLCDSSQTRMVALCSASPAHLEPTSLLAQWSPWKCRHRKLPLFLLLINISELSALHRKSIEKARDRGSPNSNTLPPRNFAAPVAPPSCSPLTGSRNAPRSFSHARVCVCTMLCSPSLTLRVKRVTGPLNNDIKTTCLSGRFL